MRASPSASRWGINRHHAVRHRQGSLHARRYWSLCQEVDGSARVTRLYELATFLLHGDQPLVTAAYRAARSDSQSYNPRLCITKAYPLIALEVKRCAVGIHHAATHDEYEEIPQRLANQIRESVCGLPRASILEFST